MLALTPERRSSRSSRRASLAPPSFSAVWALFAPPSFSAVWAPLALLAMPFFSAVWAPLALLAAAIRDTSSCALWRNWDQTDRHEIMG